MEAPSVEHFTTSKSKQIVKKFVLPGIAFVAINGLSAWLVYREFQNVRIENSVLRQQLESLPVDNDAELLQRIADLEATNAEQAQALQSISIELNQRAKTASTVSASQLVKKQRTPKRRPSQSKLSK